MAYKLLADEAPPQVEESFSSVGLRGAARTASRVGEQIAGFPGDIFSLINDYIARPITEGITGEEGVPYEDTLLGKVLPTTEQHRKGTKEALGKYIEPKNSYEKFIDDVVTDATSIALPGAKQAKLASRGFNALAVSLGGNLAADLVKDLSANEKKGAYAKLGTIALLSFFDKPSAAKAVGELYKPLSQKVGNLNPLDGRVLKTDLRNLTSKVSKGTLSKSEKFVKDEAEAVLKKIKNEKITPEEVWASKRSLNEKLDEVLFSIPKKSDQARARKLALQISNSLDNTLKLTAKQDPKFYKKLKEADRAFGTIAKSNLISRYIEKNIRYTPLTSGLIHAFNGPLGAIGAASFVPYEAGKIMYRISKSPILAKHYAKVLSSAAKEDAVIMNRELKKLDEGLVKDQDADRYRLVD